MNSHEKYMQRCLQLAQLGLGHVAPNPMVGCVVVHDERIIGEGYHHQFGKAHAEVNAIKAVPDHSLLFKSLLYVNLEPCAHYGKTPPCADYIIEKKIPKVIIGCTDTFEKVNGEGIKRLMTAGVEVILNVLQKESIEVNKRFFTFQNKKRPYIILKWAQSADGFIASKEFSATDNEGRNIQWLSNVQSRALVHKWRSEEQAIMVGTNTALKDNPKLDVRLWQGKNPIRIVIDRNLRLPVDLNVFKKDNSTLVFTEIEKQAAHNLLYFKIDFKNLLKEMLQHLYQLQIQSVIVEGGSKLLNTFINENLWDEARIFTSNQKLIDGVTAPKICGMISERMKIGNDDLSIIYNK